MASSNGEYVKIPIEDVKVVSNVRRKVGPEIADLMQSISEKGLLQPIVVKEDYELVAGHRRLEACKRIGLKKIPAVIRKGVDPEKSILQLIENTQRLDLSHLEIYSAIKKLVAERDGTLEEVAKKIGKPYYFIKMHMDYGEAYTELVEEGARRSMLDQVPISTLIHFKRLNRKQKIRLFKQMTARDTVEFSSRKVKNIVDRMYPTNKPDPWKKYEEGEENLSEEQKEAYRQEEEEFSIVIKATHLELLFVAEKKMLEIIELLKKHGGVVI